MIPWSLVLLLAPWHDTTTSLGRMEYAADGCRYQLVADADRVMQSLGHEEPDGTPWTDAQVEAARADILEYLVDRLEFSRDGERLLLEPVDLVPVRGWEPLLEAERIQSLEAAFRWPVPVGDFRLQVRHRLFEEAESGHTHLLTLVLGDLEQGPHVLYPRQTLELELEDPTPAGLRHRVRERGWRGLERAATHWELMGFAVLVMWGLPRLRAEVLVLAAFLLGLGVPLWLVGRDLLHPAPGAVGLAVHLSVGWLLVELVLLRDARLRWATAGLLGVVFGLDLGLAYVPPLLGAGPCLAAYHGGVSAAVLAAGLLGLLLAAARRRLSSGRSA